MLHDNAPGRQSALFFHENGEVSVDDFASAESVTLPAIYPERLGDRQFRDLHDCRFAYVVGAMAQGITTAEMVIAARRAGFLAFFGAAGLALGTIEAALDKIRAALGPDDRGWGSNLIHAPQSPETERQIVDLYLRKGVTRVSASAFMSLSAEIVRYAAKGMRRTEDGEVIRRNHVFAKVSHPSLARAFMSPAPTDMAEALVTNGDLSEDEAFCITRLPVACDVTAEADSGGHTDNRPAAALFAAFSKVRETVCRDYSYPADTIRIGSAGGIGTPQALAAAYTMGAAYAVTGSVNQATRESGLSATAKAKLAKVSIEDVAMAPAADMFERGVKVQVLKRGTFFPVRADRLYRLYTTYSGLDELPARDRDFVETCLGESIDTAWQKTLHYLETSRPTDAGRARASEKVKMGFLFRRYLFQCADWARTGDESHQAEYQIWCGPALGAFNMWAEGSVLEPLEARTVRRIGYALLDGAARVTRAQSLRSLGVDVPPSQFHPPAPTATDEEKPS